MSVIERILDDVEASMARRRAARPLAELQRMVRDAPPVRSLAAALAGRFSLIAELKERSPSGGAMAARNVADALPAYEASPAVSALSVLTEERSFGGSIERLAAVRRRTAKPVLRKDFVLDAYQVWEARAHGADAVLLMASLRPFVREPAKLADLHALVTTLGMDALCEIGLTSQEPIEAVAARVPPAARIWGVNARAFTWSGSEAAALDASGRDLRTDPGRHLAYRRLVPPGKLAVAESGVHAPGDLRGIADAGYDAVLIGTAFLRGPEPVQDVVAAFTAAVAALPPRRRRG